ncbi:SDR family NAD(P)-dependent oxidoreductase [Marinomonas epiphytica]
MQKTILITGSTDGIGLATARKLVSEGHYVLIHGRNPQKLAEVEALLGDIQGGGRVEGYVCDLSNLADVEALAVAIAAQHRKLDVLINNAGVYVVPNVTTVDQLDVRFVVNTIAPYLLTQRLLPLFGTAGRVINLSSAAQASVELAALTSANAGPSDGAIYAQSKLAITMWTFEMAQRYKENGPAFIAVNPASFLGSKMVKEAYGMAGKDLSIGVNILSGLALSDEYSTASGKYFDNDVGRFVPPHQDALNSSKNKKLVDTIDNLLASKVL